MEYNKLVAVSGLPGLYELISSKKDGAIVRSLSDQTTRFAATRIHQFSHLESIEIYTTGANVNLIDIFQAMEKSGDALPDLKDPKAVRSYFEQVYPELDFDRVYQSDMKKMVKWFEMLKATGVEIKATQPEAATESEAATAVEAPAPESAKKPAAKKASTKESSEHTETQQDEKTPAKAPAKKAATKKKAAPKKKAE
ncbi:hypothetical protein GCM10027051_03140 [Niabella terrae]